MVISLYFTNIHPVSLKQLLRTNVHIDNTARITNML